jgi:hypothetical protein
MLSKRRCPHTGVVNYFFADEPHFSVGSVIKAERLGYLWRCYTEPCAATGSEVDMHAAEQRVTELCREAAARQDRTYFGQAA